MGYITNIHWTDHTFNPWWGCFKVSPGCKHCYADTLATDRFHLKIFGPPSTTDRRFFGDKHWAEPLSWNKKAEKEGRVHRVFCASMADVFEEHPDLPPQRERLWKLIEATPWLEWLILTKRPEFILDMVPEDWLTSWPGNCEVGTSVENQEAAYERIQWLLGVPAPIHFLSVEPLLDWVNLGPWIRKLQWVIVGAESGNPRTQKIRPMDDDWVRLIRDQCINFGVPFHFKQRFVNGRKEYDPELDGMGWSQFPELAERSTA